MILKFQRQNVIETSSSSSDSFDTNYDLIRLMQHKNPLIKLITYGKVKKMMKQFENQDLDVVERNLMRGMFKRKHKDFTEHMQSKGLLTLSERIFDGSRRKIKSQRRQDDFSAEIDFDSKRDANSSTRQLSSNRIERKLKRRPFKREPDLDATNNSGFPF